MTLYDDLKSGVVNVKFTKVDGTERNMRCTIKEGLVPVVEKKTERVKKVNEDVMSVYDLDVNGWRSFRKNSVISYEKE